MDDTLRERIRSARSLPTPPAVTARLIELCEDPDAAVKDVIEVVGTDAALTARLMRLANSPLYARRRRTENIRQAIMLLGFDVVLTASLTLVLAAGKRSNEVRSATFRKRRWSRSVHSAAASQLLAEHVAGVNPTDAFLSALLQDIGVQVIDRLEPATYDSCDPGGTHDDLIVAEFEHLSTDHADVGAELLDAWRLPELVVEAVRESHASESDGGSLLAAVIAAGGFIADGVGGEPDGLGRAAELCASRLGIDDEVFSESMSYLVSVLPDLAAVLDADAPPADFLAELAEEAIFVRQVRAQSTATDLHDQVAELTSVAEELKTQNELDSLTGLANRRKLDEGMAHEFAMAKQLGLPLSVLFIDLDDFKLVNDRFGHSVGDELLVQAARRISASVRDGDLVGRFGGEEFVVILPGTDREHAAEVATRLIAGFGDNDFKLSGDVPQRQTASAGVATFEPDDDLSDVSELIQTADVALYAAKQGGKNQWRRGEPSNAAARQRQDIGSTPAGDR